MAPLNLNSPVAEWVLQHPQTSCVLEAAGIDYCCGGGKPLEQACRERQLEPRQVVDQLERAITGREEEPPEIWASAPLGELCDHIERTHHSYLRSNLPGLTETISRVVEAHGESHPELHQLQQVFAQLRAELEPHMMKEERVLFPAIRQLERGDARPTFPFGPLANPIGVMTAEHDGAGEALSRIRALTSNFAVPSDCCNTYRAMLHRLLELETDMHQHVHKENNILFPRATALEAVRQCG